MAQLLAVARSTTYPAERETALDLARRLHNKHRLKEALRIYAALGISKERIDKRQAWQSYLETAFHIQAIVRPSAQNSTRH